ncbi:LuxR C-terminal-related transcriptional regulator [Lentzea sp. NEAU-D7]|uniref:LuxR C-terminal-related transcriptional regulator n=1 Tax=Lentzea sp. NEAU-D7 TaxID=2994667 RepID=UPI00224B2971|nr:LuxR C-terminal-related transcriptional regulator [Lentzea sp. NEAU-D7]MCX2948491.1 LuxR C-terminal-related transcriptional regulator [Lentzea sp. NEAU-D7]
MFVWGLSAVPAVRDLDVLTDDQRAVLRCLARGHADHEIARVLGMGQQRVADEVAEILGRLELPDRVAAVVFAHEAGMLHLPFPR